MQARCSSTQIVEQSPRTPAQLWQSSGTAYRGVAAAAPTAAPHPRPGEPLCGYERAAQRCEGVPSLQAGSVRQARSGHPRQLVIPLIWFGGAGCGGSRCGGWVGQLRVWPRWVREAAAARAVCGVSARSRGTRAYAGSMGAEILRCVFGSVAADACRVITSSGGELCFNGRAMFAVALHAFKAGAVRVEVTMAPGRCRRLIMSLCLR